MLESSRVSFDAGGAIWKRVVRYLIGVAGTVAIWRGLALLFALATPDPEAMLWLVMPLRFVRYALLGLWVAYYAPWLFVRLGLAARSADSATGYALVNNPLRDVPRP
jgi:hypothetical protein